MPGMGGGVGNSATWRSAAAAPAFLARASAYRTPVMDSFEKSVVARIFRIFKRAGGTMLLRRAFPNNLKGFFFITNLSRDSKPPNKRYLVRRSIKLRQPSEKLGEARRRVVASALRQRVAVSVQTQIGC